MLVNFCTNLRRCRRLPSRAGDTKARKSASTPLQRVQCLDVARGRTTREDKIGNDGADELAVAGAAAHTVPSEVVEAAAARRRSAMQTHEMMLAILAARQLEENESGEADRGSDMGECMELDCIELDCIELDCMEFLDDAIGGGEGILSDAS